MKNKVKKTTVGILAAAMVLFIGVTSVFAGVQKRNENFTDTNYDGVCDNYGTCIQGACVENRDEKNFVDADNDGVCDNYETHHQEESIGREAGQRKGFGRRCHR